MDSLMPPPSGSPEEIQAWNDMMDTMVTFIKASTNLMNTITRKVRYTSSSPAAGLGNPTEGCEPECAVCHPKPPCGICGKAASQTILKTTPTSKTQNVRAASTPQPRQTPVAEIPEEEEGAAAEGGEEKDGEEAGGEEAGGEETAESEVTEDAPAEEKLPEIEQSTIIASNSAGGGGGGGAAGSTGCVCDAIRAKRLESQTAQCVCDGKGKKEEDEQQTEKPERLCGCGATQGNTDAMVHDMIQKLANAQREITELQEEMARLQRMDASRKTGAHGGPNPAALYREIMKDSGVPPQSFNQTQQGATQCFSPSQYGPSPQSYSQPQRFAPNNVRQRLFQTTGSSGQMMRPPGMMQQTSSMGMGSGAPGMQSASRYYAGAQSPCRRTASRQDNQSPGLGTTFDDSSGQNYWNRQPSYGSPGSPNVEMIPCPWGARNSPQMSPPPPPPPPPRRRIICGPPPRAPSDCDPDCTLRSM